MRRGTAPCPAHHDCCRYLYELFDMDNDPYELHNIYGQASDAFKALLHQTVQIYYLCAGKTCPW